MESVSSGSPAHPNVQLWDKIYESKKDHWTTAEADDELMKFHDTLTDGKRHLDVLLPMCGKAQSLLSLCERGHRVVGIEWSRQAVELFFEDNGLPYSSESVTINGVHMSVYKANEKNITIYCGDFFAFRDSAKNLGGFDCVFDHGAIGCFDFTLQKRSSYAEIINSFTRSNGRVLLSTFDYEHSEHPTIPFAVTEEEIKSLYEVYFEPPQLLADLDAEKSADVFNLRAQGAVRFPVWNFSRFSWKILLLVKKQSDN